jgi:hypothetical protein
VVIKDNKLRQNLWNLHFVNRLSKKECVAITLQTEISHKHLCLLAVA